jgi:hypothetical protein
MLACGVTVGVTLMVTVLLVAVAAVVHAALLVNTQLTTSPLLRLLVIKTALFAPALLPFTCHWYTGAVPAFAGVAVKVIDVPEQI